METRSAVFGVYKTQKEIDVAVEELKHDQFTVSEISVIVPDLAKKADHPELVTHGLKPATLAIPGVGPVIVAGPLESALTAAMSCKSLPVARTALMGFGIPEYEASRYEGYLKDGGFLLSILVADPAAAKKAQDILKRTGAEDVAASSDNNFLKNAIVH